MARDVTALGSYVVLGSALLAVTDYLVMITKRNMAVLMAAFVLGGPDSASDATRAHTLGHLTEPSNLDEGDEAGVGEVARGICTGGLSGVSA